MKESLYLDEEVKELLSSLLISIKMANQNNYELYVKALEALRDLAVLSGSSEEELESISEDFVEFRLKQLNEYEGFLSKEQKRFKRFLNECR